MQRIDRRVEIAVLLLQPCELGFEFALIFVGHDVRWLKNAMRLRKWVDLAYRNIVLAGPVRKLKRSPDRFLTHDSLQMAAEI